MVISKAIFSSSGVRGPAAILALVLAAAIFAAPALSCQSTTSPSRKTSKPYTGDLTIFDSPGREDRLQINRVMDLLKIGNGTLVADIGAGSGWFTVRAAKRVGAAGEVYAVDINPEAIDYIQKRAAKEHLANVKTVLGKSDDPLLPPGKIQAALLLKTYHEVAEPVAQASARIPGAGREGRNHRSQWERGKPWDRGEDCGRRSAAGWIQSRRTLRLCEGG